MVAQFKRLCHRLRLRFRKRRWYLDYTTATKLYVAHCTIPSRLRASLGMYRLERAARFDQRCLAGLLRICEFAGDLMLGVAFECKPALANIGMSRRLLTGRYGNRTLAVFKGTVGDFAVVASGSRRVVRVVTEVREVNCGAIARAIDLDQTLHCPSDSDPHCWHACRVVHRFRFAMPPEKMLRIVGATHT